MGQKFIPNGDIDFVTMAESFARAVVKDPARFTIGAEDAQELDAAVKQYRASLQACRHGGRSEVATRAKDVARERAEQIIRRLAHLVRANPKVDSVSKVALGIKERTAKAKVLPCPQEPPRLKFVRALHEGDGSVPMHELSFGPIDSRSRVKPPGAIRLELFVDLVAPDEPIPSSPGANHGGRPWYLRSYTRSPIRLTPPMARVPMRVVYWGRWADSAGNVGPLSATAVAWMEGGAFLRTLAPALGSNQPPQMLELTTSIGSAGRETTYRVAVLEAQYESINPNQMMTPTLPAPEAREVRQLEGPAEDEMVEASGAA